MKEIKPKPNQEIIEQLEEFLEAAKTGEIQSIAICGANNDASTFNYFHAPWHVMAVLGEMRCLERDFVDECIDIRRKPAREFCE